MSRSYKHTPYCSDPKHMKEYANRKVRRSEDVPMKGNAYRKYFQQYDICDFYTIYSGFEEYYRNSLKLWYKYGKRWGEPFPDRDECWKEYNKWYLRK